MVTFLKENNLPLLKRRIPIIAYWGEQLIDANNETLIIQITRPRTNLVVIICTRKSINTVSILGNDDSELIAI